MNALTKRSTLMGRSYQNQTLQTITDDLIGLVPDGARRCKQPMCWDTQSARLRA